VIIFLFGASVYFQWSEQNYYELDELRFWDLFLGGAVISQEFYYLSILHLINFIDGPSYRFSSVNVDADLAGTLWWRSL